MSNNAEDDDGLFDEDDDDSSDEEIAVKKSKKRKAPSGGAGSKKSKPSWIDDAAEESGDEGGDDDDDEEDDDENENDYIKDGFVVDEDDEDVEDKKKKKKKEVGDLEDSDDDDNDDDDDDDDDSDDGKAKKKKKFRKVRQLDMLAEEDLDLIRESQATKDAQRERQEVVQQKVRARNEEELQKGLFYDSAEEDDGGAIQPSRAKGRQIERYDEDGMDDFIDDDIGDQGQILAAERRNFDEEGVRGISEAQLNEASEIFGTEYLDFMAQDEENADDEEEDLFGKGKYRERGVGVDLGVDSEEDLSEDDDEDEDDEDDDLFGDDDAGDGLQAKQKAEALKLKRQKRELARQERRQQKEHLKTEKRKAQLRRAFEPVQLVENFCTDRDDEIRNTDAPERFFDWKTPFHGSMEGGDTITDEEEEEVIWIMGRIPEIKAEYSLASRDEDRREDLENAITSSIAHALRFLHKDKFEPAFIKRYRKDVVTSPAVRENLYNIMDEDAEWDTLTQARSKVGNLLENIATEIQTVEAAGAEAESVVTLEQDLAQAIEKLEEVAHQESVLKDEIEALGPIEEDKGDDDDDDDDELFGDDDDDDGKKDDKKDKKDRLDNHLATVQALLQDRAEKVATLETQVRNAREQTFDSSVDRGPAQRVTKKICRHKLWNDEDIVDYLSGLTDLRHILDVNGYFNVLKEGNDAIRKKEMPSKGDSDKTNDDRKRSRRFDRDFYRTCVSEGHRDISYRFLLPPHRVGIKLEDTLTSVTRTFDYSKTMPGEDSPAPHNWVPPVLSEQTPGSFANDLVGSGELVLLSSASGADPDDQEAKARDPLRGCRYVAAMELAHEPRVRRHLRNLYRQKAFLTTRPTKKGMDAIDAFHDYYGLHLIKNKPIKEHFPMDEKESIERKSQLGPEECKELDAEMKKRQTDSCLQYINILKAEKTGHIEVHVHLPPLEDFNEWWKEGNDYFSSREKQDLSALMNELERVYFPLDGDTEEWNEERRKVLNQALQTFLLPQFENETRRELREAATKVGVIAAGENLYSMAMEGPYRPQYLMHTQNRFINPTGNLPMVGICVGTDTREATYISSVTELGELNDHLGIPGGARIDSPQNRERVIKFLLQSRPAAVLVGTSGGFASRIMCRKMNEIINEAIQRWNNRDIQGEDEDDDEYMARQEQFRKIAPRSHYDDDDEADLEWKCNVELVDDSVSQLFGRSVRGKKEFPDNAVNLKIATSIARYAKDPLAELAYAWCVASDTGNFGAELLYINIYPMQQLLPKIMLLRQYERALCEAVAEVGVDLNATCNYDHLHGLLTFVPGLGPRKANNLKQGVEQFGGSVVSRRSLLEKRLMGPTVYNNGVAFLRILELDQMADQLIHPLDDTRLHPDVYHRNNWAAKIATDALERAEDEARNKEKASIKAIRDVMDNSGEEVDRIFNATKQVWERDYGPTFNIADWDPKKNVPAEYWKDKVEELDLDQFALMLESTGLGRWHSHLQMIKWEFRLPFADPRKPMEPLKPDQLFKLITGETDQSLRPGKEITGKVSRNGDFGSRVKLEGDIPAFIPLRNLSDEHVETAEDIVGIGDVVHAVVTEVKKDHMCVDLSLKMEDKKRLPSSWDRPESLPQLDDYFDRAASSAIEELKRKERDARLEALRLSDPNADGGGIKPIGGRVARRACAHPAFRNAKQAEVSRELEEAGADMVGEALIRPSNRSSESLAIHWVVREGCVKVIEVIEEDKDTDASIGNVLKIKGESYGSIDELLGRYIAPMNDYVEEIVNHRKFTDLPEDELDEKLRKEKTANPKGVFYNICWMEGHPGHASLHFVLSSTPRQHPIGISPNGYVWGTKTFGKLDGLLNEFKKNPRGSSTSKRPAASSSRPQPPPPRPAESAPKPSRWGNKPPAPPVLPPPQPVQGNWGAAASNGGQWNQPPPPNMPPPPYGRLPPPSQPPPPSFGRPPPPGPPPDYQQNSNYPYQQPPPPPSYPPRI